MFTVVIINEKGEEGKMFTLDLDGVNKLLSMSTPLKVTFKIQRVSK